MHRLCKYDEWCALIRLEELEKENEENVEKLKGVGDCGDLPFNHKASKKAKIYIKASKDSKVVGEVKKGQKLLFYAVSTKNKNFSRVKIRKDDICAEGYIESKYLVKKDAEDTVVNAKLFADHSLFTFGDGAFNSNHYSSFNYGSNNLVDEPLFADTLNNDFHLNRKYLDILFHHLIGLIPILSLRSLKHRCLYYKNL